MKKTKKTTKKKGDNNPYSPTNYSKSMSSSFANAKSYGSPSKMSNSKPGAMYNSAKLAASSPKTSQSTPSTMLKKSKNKKWIANAIKKPGSLKKELAVKKGSKIPTKKLASAIKKGGKIGKRARLAETLKGLSKSKKSMKKGKK